MEIPVYLIWGFLESGKTSFIKDTLGQEYFADGERTMILSFEEGEEEYEKDFLEKSNSFVIQVDDMDDFSSAFVENCEKNYHPDRIMIEYNGMYQIEDVMDVIDETDMELYQIIVMVDASTAELYLKNMRSIMVEMFKMADMAIFNRCTDETNASSYRRSIKAVNRRAQVGFERADGREFEMNEMLLYDPEAEIIKVEEDDFGIWYIDVLERSNMYLGKVVELSNVFIRRPNGIPAGLILPGRSAMTCCEDDITFIGFICKMRHAKSSSIKKVKDGSWAVLTAKIGMENHEAYGGERGPVLQALRIEEGTQPKEKLIYF